MLNRTLLVSSAFALVASLSLSACAPDDPRVDLADGAAVTPVASSDAAPQDDAAETSVYIAPGALVVRWTFSEAGVDAASSCAANGVATVRIETGLGGPVTVPCAAGERRFEGLTAGMYSVTVEALSESGAPVGDDYYGVATVRSRSEAFFDVSF